MTKLSRGMKHFAKYDLNWALGITKTIVHDYFSILFFFNFSILFFYFTLGLSILKFKG